MMSGDVPDGHVNVPLRMPYPSPVPSLTPAARALPCYVLVQVGHVWLDFVLEQVGLAAPDYGLTGAGHLREENREDAFEFAGGALSAQVA